MKNSGVELMSISEEEFSLTKQELRLYSLLIKFGPKTKKELILSLDLQEKGDKFEEILGKLIQKGLITSSDDFYYPSIPIENIINILNLNLTTLKDNQKNVNDSFSLQKKILDENLKILKNSLENQLNESKSINSELNKSLKSEISEIEKTHVGKAEELTENFIGELKTRYIEKFSETQSKLSTEEAQLEKNWATAVEGFYSLPASGTRNIRESVSHYEKELSNIIDTTTTRIEEIQSQMGDILTVLETESASQLNEFFSNTQTASNEFKTNLLTEIGETRKHEKDFISDVRKNIQVNFVEKIDRVLKKVSDGLIKEIDEEIDKTLVNIRKETLDAISDSSSKLKAEFQEFKDNASELILEQKSYLEVLDSELSDFSNEQKLANKKELFIKQLQAHLSTDITSLETNYLRIQKTVTEIMESIRRTAKNKLIEQTAEFDVLLNKFSDVTEKHLSRKDTDIIRLQQLSQSIDQFLRNLLVSIPGRANQFKTSLKDSFDSSINEVQNQMGDSTYSSIQEINTILQGSQKRVQGSFKESIDDSKREIANVIASLDQFATTITNLQSNYSEKIEPRFDQRAKIMNTELEAVARNFQQVLNGMESGYADINEKLASEHYINVTNIQSSFQSSSSQLKGEIDSIFSQNRAKNQEYLSQLDSTLQVHLDRTIEAIKEGFSQIKDEFNTELENQVKELNGFNEEQQANLSTTVESFIQQGEKYLEDFRTNLGKNLDENQKKVSEFITETRKSTNEVVSLHKSNISKYQEKGPTDILSFIKQIESEISNQTKNVREAMEELEVYYNELSDSTQGEISRLLLQVQESGDKLKALVKDSLHVITNSLERANESIDTYFSDSLTDLENQVGVASGFITSEVETSALSIQEEVEVLKKDLKDNIDKLSSGVKEIIESQDQDFQIKIPEFSKEFDQTFQNMIGDRKQQHQDLEQKTQESLESLIVSWNKQMSSGKEKLVDVSTQLDKAIGNNLENLRVILDSNIESTLKQINTIYHIEDSKDIFGLKEIQATIKQTNKRIQSAISEMLKSHIEEFDSNIPDIVNSYEAIHAQTEEDLNKYLEDLGDLISSYQTSVTNQFRNYLKDERENIDFKETNEELKAVVRNFSQSTSQNIESLSKDLEDNIKLSLDQINKSKTAIEALFNNLNQIKSEENEKLSEELTKFKNTVLTSLEQNTEEIVNQVSANIDRHYNELEKSSLAQSGNVTNLIQRINDEIEKQILSIQTETTNNFTQMSQNQDSLQVILEKIQEELSQTKPLETIRTVNLDSDESKSTYILDILKSAEKNVTIFSSNPTFLPVADLKSIPSQKRIWIFTSFDFTKKGKKWFTDLSEQVNINLREAKAKKINGIFVIQDEKLALVLPENLGLLIADPKFVTNLSALLGTLKGSTIRGSS